MRSLIIVLTMFVCSTASAAQEMNSFYKWADRIVIDAVLNSKSDTVIVKVTDQWEDQEVPLSYRLSLTTYVVCTRFARELETAKGLHSKVRLANTDRPQNSKAEGWAPGGARACDHYLARIKEQILED